MKLTPEQKYQLRSWWRKRGPTLLQLVAAYVFAMVSVEYFYPSSAGRSLELYILEQFYQLRGLRPVPSDVVIVAIDDETYMHLKLSTKHPIPRRHIAEALETIQRNSPRLLTLDAKLPEERTIDPEADARIEAVLKNTPSTIWSGELGARKKAKSDMILPSDERFRLAAKLELPMILYTIDNTVMYISNPRAEESTLFSRVPIARALVELVGVTPPTPGPSALINFYGEPGTVPRVSLYQLLGDASQEVQALTRGKIVLVGYQSLFFGKMLMQKDEFPTPVSPSGMFGVEVHASVIANLLEGSWLSRFELGIEITLLALSILLMGAAALKAPNLITLAAIWGTLLVVCVGAYIAFAWYHFWYAGLGTMLTAGALVTAGSALYLFRRAQNYKRYLDRTFSFEREREL